MTPTRGTSTGTDDVEAQLRALERRSGTGEIGIGRGASLHVSSLGKLYFPLTGATKGALMRYYTRVWPQLQPHLKDRPLVLKRYPEGVGGPMFFQQNAGPDTPDAVRVAALETENEGVKPRFIGGDLATLLYTVQMGAIEVHPWLAQLKNINSADRCLIDLDPAEDVPFTDTIDLARRVVALVTECNLPCAVKTSGSSGIHIVLPLPRRTSFDQSAALASMIAQTIAAYEPSRATIQRSIHARPPGTIYVDAMQNARGKSMAAPYSVRANPSGAVSTPLRTTELTARLWTTTFTMKSVPGRVTRNGDLWGDALQFLPTTQVVTKAMETLQAMLASSRS